MENFKFILVSVIILAVLGLAGFWAVSTLESGSTHVNSQKIKTLEKENEELKKELEETNYELGVLKPEEPVEEEVITPPKVVEEVKTEKPPAKTPTTYKYQTLINELQELIDEKVFMKEKSRGTRVGTIQNFLNLYNKTNKRIDNDYGKGTKTDVSNFQKAVGLSQTGETSAATYQKMIDWLKKQG
jgi:seryl-tRNA synthetase